jgi:hypothetical protein
MFNQTFFRSLLLIVSSHVKLVSQQDIDDLFRTRLVNSTAGGGSEFGRLVSVRPCRGRELGDSTDWKITQSRQDGTQIVADRDFESPTGFDH